MRRQIPKVKGRAILGGDTSSMEDGKFPGYKRVTNIKYNSSSMKEVRYQGVERPVAQGATGNINIKWRNMGQE